LSLVLTNNTEAPGARRSAFEFVGLADAWDAMTMARPYRPALTLGEAASEVRGGRGTQFAPVEAFFTALRRQSAVFEVEPAPAVTGAAG
jgi:HD-GYP domain-containing protein (c-di-GMP phosphodiesterase class II)